MNEFEKNQAREREREKKKHTLPHTFYVKEMRNSVNVRVYNTS